jgi:ABC-2 type transport system ATP-binding protein
MKIEVKNLNKSFNKIEVLKDINITFESGKIYGLIGRNGSGKSVFLKLLCGFYKPTSGKILYDGIDISGNNTFPKDTRALIEKPCFLPDLTGLENLILLADIQKKIGTNEIYKTLKDLNLYEEKDKKYSTYSLGTKQKLGLAQVLMEDPKVIILDEPLNGIENKTAEKFREIIKKEKEKGKLIIIASHIKEDIDTLADITYEVDDGKIIKKK